MTRLELVANLALAQRDSPQTSWTFRVPGQVALTSAPHPLQPSGCMTQLLWSGRPQTHLVGRRDTAHIDLHSPDAVEEGGRSNQTNAKADI
jgi:hypothetical protein